MEQGDPPGWGLGLEENHSVPAHVAAAWRGNGQLRRRGTPGACKSRIYAGALDPTAPGSQ